MVPGKYTSTILASIPGKIAETIMKNKMWPVGNKLVCLSSRGNCASPLNGEKKHTAKGDSVDILGFSENL